MTQNVSLCSPAADPAAYMNIRRLDLIRLDNERFARRKGERLDEILPIKKFRGDCFEDLYIAILAELMLYPEYTPSPRGVQSREITDLSFELTNPRARHIWNLARNVNYEFAMKFFLWILNGDNDFEYVAGSNQNAARFIDPPKDPSVPANFSTAYGPRIAKQLPAIIEELVRDPESRRAVIHVLNEDDHAMLGTETNQEYPCADSFTFMIRNDQLQMYTHMRSNNMVLTLCYDVFVMTMLHEYLWRKLCPFYPTLKLGTYYHTAVSAHYFEREQPLVEKILANTEVGMKQKKPQPTET